ncbi:MAG: PglZ domain-containing protein [Collinsella sp.]
MSAAERKELLKSSEIVYLYHNKIDATGEKLATESDVFDACAESVDELVSIAKRVCTDVPGARVTITSDHGFLFTANELPECLFQARTPPDDPVLFGKRRRWSLRATPWPISPTVHYCIWP